MSTGTNYQNNYADLKHHAPIENNLYQRVANWVIISLLSMVGGVFILGPLVPPALILPLGIVVIVGLIIASFVRVNKVGSDIMAVVIPVVLGALLYPSLNYYVSTGSGDIIGMAAAGAIMVFGTISAVAWQSKKSMDRWAPKLFAIVLGIIGLSLLNVLFFKVAILSFLISVAVLVIFSIYTFIDIQRVRDHKGNTPPSGYALNLFLNLYNMFVSLLNILGFLRS